MRWTSATADASMHSQARGGSASSAAWGGRQPTRTSRELFLTGQIERPGRPAEPLESLKLPLYGLEPDERGRLRAPFGVVLPLRPLDEIVRAAWEACRP